MWIEARPSGRTRFTRRRPGVPISPRFGGAFRLGCLGERSPDGAQRNPGRHRRFVAIPYYAALHPGYACYIGRQASDSCQENFMSKKKDRPKTTQPWDRRSWPARGDAEMDKLYAAVGRLLSQWERYEAALALLFSGFVAGFDNKPARRAYSAVRTFEGRAEMLRAASTAYFAEHPDDKTQEAFKTVLKEAVSFSQRRNDVAHGVTDFYFPEAAFASGNIDGYIVENEYGLYPSAASFKERSLANAPTYCYTSVELDYFHGHFFRLVNEAMKVAGLVLRGRRRRPSLRRHYEQA
jgi:hypothetical protein